MFSTSMKQRKTKECFSAKEDQIILEFVQKHVYDKIPELISQLSNHTARQIREHYNNYLNSIVNHDPFSIEEGETLFQLISINGTKWSFIAKKMAGRTDIQLKHRFKRLQKEKSVLNVKDENLLEILETSFEDFLENSNWILSDFTSFLEKKE
jgi:phage pi2 protein 07